MMWIAYAIAWISTAAAVSVGMYYTHNPKVLWALLIPALIRVTRSDKDKEKEKEKADE